MSFRVGTPNYGLPQTEGTDKRDWSDTNQAFLAIDTAIKNAVDTSASASSAAGTAQQTADGANTAAAHAQTDATTAQNLANSANELAILAKSKADTNEAAIAQINSDLSWKSIDLRNAGVVFSTTGQTYQNDLLKGAREIMIVPLVAGILGIRQRLILTPHDLTACAFNYTENGGATWATGIAISNFNNIAGSFEYSVGGSSSNIINSIQIYQILYR